MSVHLVELGGDEIIRGDGGNLNSHYQIVDKNGECCFIGKNRDLSNEGELM